MAKPILTIIGLGTTGSSMGLALQRDESNFEIVGHDKEPNAAQQAKKIGAVQRTEWNLHSACEGADLNVLALPMSEVKDTLPLIAEDLLPGNMVMAATSIMQPVIELADSTLAEGVHFVAGHPILPGVGSALAPRADLFDEAVFCLAPSTQTAPEAIQLASDFVERIGAKPLYVDGQEHDGIIAGVELLPQLMSAALMRNSAEAPGWQESKRMAGRRFALASEPGGTAQQMFDAFMSDRQNLAMRVEQLQQALNQWRGFLSSDEAPEGEEHPLLIALQESVDERNQWESQVTLKQWDDSVDAPAEESGGGMLRQMLFGSMFSRKPTPSDDESKDKSQD
jgi:prephenate dehydrogenase